MINGHDLYMVFSAMMPLYLAMILACASVRWWGIFTEDQCDGIHKFVANFAIPFLCFDFIAKSNPYAMNLTFIAADTLQKIFLLVVLIFWASFTKTGNLDWLITIFPLSTLPNNLVIGVPMLVAMYGEYCQSLMVQIVVMQCIIWYTLLLFLFEYREAKMRLTKQYPDAAGSIRSVKSDSNITSLHGNLETDTIFGVDGKMIVTFRKSSTSAPTLPRSYDPNIAQCFPRRNSSFGNQNLAVVLEAPTADSARCNRSRVSDLNCEEASLSISESGVSATEDGQSTTFRPPSTEKQSPPASVMIWPVLVVMRRSLIRNPNIYASLIGLVWSLIQFRWNIKMPIIIENSIALLSDAGLGMAMFSIGLYMALQPSLIPCGKTQASYAMAARFITGPAVMAVASLVVGIRGELLKVAIVQGMLPFVYANRYDVHPKIHCTALIIGMVIALPVTLIYYILLGL